MNNYKIEITEVLQRVIEIQANSLDDAIAKVNIQYNNEEIVLDNSDCIDTEIKHVENV